MNIKSVYKEVNPRINLNTKLVEKRIVLGSFPTWSISSAMSGHVKRREIEREINGDVN